MVDQQAAQFLNGLEYFLSRLLGEHISEDGAERAYVTAERIVFDAFVRWSRQLRQPGLLVVYLPQWV